MKKIVSKTLSEQDQNYFFCSVQESSDDSIQEEVRRHYSEVELIEFISRMQKSLHLTQDSVDALWLKIKSYKTEEDIY